MSHMDAVKHLIGLSQHVTHMYIYMYVCLSVWLAVWLSDCLSGCLTRLPSIHLSVCQSVRLCNSQAVLLPHVLMIAYTLSINIPVQVPVDSMSVLCTMTGNHSTDQGGLPS